MNLDQFCGKIVYIAGPYSGKSDGENYYQERDMNVDIARDIAKKFWRVGAVVICPHLNSYDFEGVTSYENFILGYLHLIQRVDVVCALPNWENSAGARLEIEYARRLGREIFYWEED